MGGALVALGDIAFFAIFKKNELLSTGIRIFAGSFAVMLLGWVLSLYHANTKNASEVERRNKLKELRYSVWKKAIETNVTSDKRKEFFTYLFKIQSEGTKKRRVFVTLSDWIITGILIVNSLPGFDALESSGFLMTVAWFGFLLFCNLVVNKIISTCEDKILKENYYVQGLVNDYALVVLAKNA